MWSGGRSIRKIAVAGGILSSLGTTSGQVPLCNGQHHGNPELISGAASCAHNEVGGIGHTLIDLSDTSIIRWNHLGLENPASTLTFRWSGDPSGNPTVINRVEGGNVGRGQHLIAGTVQFADGNLVITNPNSTPRITGTVAARSVIFVAHQLDPVQAQALLDGLPVDFTGAQQPLEIRDGAIVATHGDVVLAGRRVQNSSFASLAEDAPEIVAEQGSVRIFGGENFRLLPGGSERIVPLPGAPDGSVRSTKGIRAARDVEISATAAIDNFARIDANRGGGRVFLRVDDLAGQINNEAAGAINGFVIPSLPVTNSGRITDNGADSPSPLSTGISRVRVPPRPGARNKESKTVVLFENAPTAGSASAQRDRPGSRTTTASRRGGTRLASNTTAPLARGSSFFWLRGGKRVEKKKTR